MKFVLSVLLIGLCSYVGGTELVETSKNEARGKGAKYALLTHLAIAIAAKVGLYKIILGIAFVVASIKIMVIMAWALAIFRLAPDLWPKFQSWGPLGKQDTIGPSSQNGFYDFLIDMIKSQH